MRLTVALCALALVASTTAVALDAATKCESSKLKTAGKYGFCRLKEEAKAAKTNTTPDFSKCDDNLSLKWALAETKGAGMCPSNGDESALQAFITQHTDDVAAALAGGPLPDCPGDLGTCNEDLESCNSSNAECNDLFTVCSSDREALQDLLNICDTGLGTCMVNLSEALTCGNGAIDAGEDCDQANLGDHSCVTQGFAGGTLACGSGCAFEMSSCYAARFADNADGTITDNETGLMWEKKTELDGSTNFTNLHEADNYYPWAGSCSLNPSKNCQPTTAAATLCAANAEGGTTGCEECMGGDGTCDIAGTATDTAWTWAVALNTASFAGYTDWRLPTRSQFEKIQDLTKFFPAADLAFHSGSCGTGCTDITDPDCSCTKSYYYWSASAYAQNLGSAWLADFNVGVVVAGSPTIEYYVRAVRGGS